MYSGLSLEQAPPLSVVLRFFLSVPLFGMALSALLFLDPPGVLTPLHPHSLAAVHLLFLGVISMSMIGALFQMQSVLGGRAIPAPAGNALIIHTLLFAGTLALACAFAFSLLGLFTLASVLLGAAILYTANLVLPLLFGGVTHDTLRGMRLALVAFAATAVLGVVMASSYASASFGPYHAAIRTSHYSLGLIGWVGALIIAVAFQVIEMFYVTDPYSPWCKRNAFRLLAAALVFKLALLFSGWPYGWIGDLVIAAWMIGFALTTLKRLAGRKRRVSDVSIRFWNTGMLLLGAAVTFHLISLQSNTPEWESASLIAFSLFALAIILGMMGKIVPFLVWFHLSSQGYMDAPVMSAIIPAKRAKLLFTLFSLTSLLLLGGIIWPEAFGAGGMIAFFLFATLLYNLLQALKLYRHTLRHGTRFTME